MTAGTMKVLKRILACFEPAGESYVIELVNDLTDEVEIMNVGEELCLALDDVAQLISDHEEE